MVADVLTRSATKKKKKKKKQLTEIAEARTRSISFCFISAIYFLRVSGGHDARFSRACAVALSAISGHDAVGEQDRIYFS